MKRQPVILTVTLHGASRQPADHPALPLASRELADTARHCLDAGAAMLHVHVRDAQGLPARHNAQLVAQAADAARALGRPLARAAQVRAMFGH